MPASPTGMGGVLKAYNYIHDKNILIPGKILKCFFVFIKKPWDTKKSFTKILRKLIKIRLKVYLKLSVRA